MQLKTSQFLLWIFLIGIISISCDDSLEPNPNEKDSNWVPVKIVTKAVLNAAPWYNYTYTTEVEYDKEKRPLFIRNTTERVHQDTKVKEQVSVVDMELAYPDDHTIQTVNSVERLSADESETETYSNTYIYSFTDSEVETMILIKKDGEEDGVIKVDKEKRLIVCNGLRNLYSGERVSFTVQYEYDKDGNITKHKSISYDGYIQQQRFRTDKKNGIYRNVNLPLWFLVSQFKSQQATEEHAFNNATEITSSVGEKDNFHGYGTNHYEYNSHGYPVMKTFRPSMDLIGIWGNTSAMDYQYIP